MTPRWTGADPALLAAVAAAGPGQAWRLDVVGRSVARAAAAYRAGTDHGGVVDDRQVLEGLRALAEGVLRLDAWTDRVAAALRDADVLPASLTHARLALLREQLGGGAVPHLERVVAAAREVDADGVDLDALWASLDPALLDDTTAALLGASPDLPLDLRDRTNRVLAGRHVADLERRVAELGERLATLDAERTWRDRLAHDVEGMVDDLVLDRLAVVADLLVRLDERRARLAREAARLRGLLAAPDLTLLALVPVGTGPDGDATLRVAIGDLATATHVAVLVPGTTTGLRTPTASLADARRLSEAATAIAGALGDGGPRVATVLALHDAPDDLVTAAGTAHARAGGHEVRAAVDDVAAVTGGAHVTLVGHSHGATVVGHAQRADGATPVADVVLLGAPGVGVDHARHLAVTGEVWAGTAPDDPIGLLWPAGRVLGALAPGADGLLGRVAAGPHGPDPTTPAFGAADLPLAAAVTDTPTYGPRPVSGHVAYLRAGSAALTAAARVVVGLAATGGPAPDDTIIDEQAAR